ncbi:MAG: hypothetical protein ACI4GY_11055 [Acutalibacteraceae bacterium]
MFSEQRKEDIEKFISMILHDDHDSNYFICHYSDGSMHSLRTSRSEFSLEQIKEKDCYFSLNGFAGYHRKSDECRQINGIVLDLDYHKESTKEFRRWIVGRNLAIILDAVDACDIPEPNIITNTGRGIQLLYLFENSISYFTKNGETNEKAIYAYRKIQEEIAEKIKSVLPEKDGLEIDYNVNDISRVVRIPGTKNSKSGTVASIVHTNDEYYSFSDFFTKKASTDKKVPCKSSVKISCSNKELQQIRINELEKLMEIRNGNCEGYRNYMALLYYNAAVQIYEKETAKNMLFDFCKKFNPGATPFTKSQIKAIIRSVDSNKSDGYTGYYIFTKQWIIEHLAITEDEANAIGFSTYVNKRERTKQKNRQNKQERNTKIIEMHNSGAVHSDIAKTLGVSLRTVQTVIKNAGLSRSYSKKINVQKNAA